MPPVDRVVGIETEYGSAAYRRGKRSMSEDRLLRYFGEPGVRRWLRNGACYYRDGSHPEYATPECASLLDLLAHDKAGERYLAAMTRDIEQRQAGAAVYAFKNNTDSYGVSYGCHENYQLDNRMLGSIFTNIGAADGDAIAALGSFLATRPLIAGAGGYIGPAHARTYVLSPRAEHMAEVYSSNTLGQGGRGRRGMFSAGISSWGEDAVGRLQIISGDATMSETTTMLKIGSTDLVLRMVGAEVPLSDLTLRDPVGALRRVSRDLTGQVPLQCVDGRERTAVELQRALHLRAAAFCRDAGITDPETTLVLQLWDRALTALEEGDLSQVGGMLDWVLKKDVIDRYADRNDLPPGSPRLVEMAMAYHDVRPERSLYYLLERRGAAERVLDDGAVSRATSVPPPTRAALRGAVVGRAEEVGGEYVGDWERLGIREADGEIHTVICTDPRPCHDTDVTRLICGVDPPMQWPELRLPPAVGPERAAVPLRRTPSPAAERRPTG